MSNPTSKSNECFDSAPSARFDHAADGESDGPTDASDVETFETAWIAAIKSSSGSVPSVNEEPVVALTGWLVFRMPNGTCRLAGRNVRERKGRASTAVGLLGPEERQVVTASGRLYELVGPPGVDPNARGIVRDEVTTRV